MFKVQVINYKGQLENHLWQNGLDDDFIRFLPKHFGVPKENLTIFKFLDELQPAVLLYKSNENNYVDLSTSGKAIVCRRFKKQFEVGEEVGKEQFDMIVGKCESVFSDVYPVTVSTPTLQTRVVNEGTAEEYVEEYYIIPAEHALTEDILFPLQTYVGVELQNSFPYDADMNFLGNN